MAEAIGVYVVRWFRQWMGKQGLKDWQLCAAVMEMSRGLFDAALGGGLYKKRVARCGAGKRGGYRTLVASKRDGRWFFVYGFAKNSLANVRSVDESRFRRGGATLMALSPQALREHIRSGDIYEVICNEKTRNPDCQGHPGIDTTPLQKRSGG